MAGVTCHQERKRSDFCSQVLKREEESRFERLGSKLKAQRLEAEERKKEREVKLTDRVPPPKRPRSGGCKSRLPGICTVINRSTSLVHALGGAPTQPKTLLQKTLSEASKIQKAMYNSRSIPPMANGKSYRVLAKGTCPIIPEPKSIVSNRVCVNTVHKRLVCGPSGTSKIPASLPQPPSNRNPTPLSQASHGPVHSHTTLKTAVPKPNTLATSNAPHDGRPMRTVTSVKKDPMAALFVPKHRAHSQRPV
jgi:elongin-A